MINLIWGLMLGFFASGIAGAAVAWQEEDNVSKGFCYGVGIYCFVILCVTALTLTFVGISQIAS